MKKIRLIMVLVMVLVFLLPVFAVSAEVIDTTDLYRYQGTGISGHTYWEGHSIYVKRFDMSKGYIAFCADRLTPIRTDKDYVKISLEYAASHLIIPEIIKNKIRAILNYSWNKTDKDSITAVQYALWHYLHGTGLPDEASAAVKAIYNDLLDDTKTPCLPASAESVVNNLTLNPPTPDSQDRSDGETTYTFNFFAQSSEGAPIVFTVKDAADQVLADAAYDIIDAGSGNYQLKLYDIHAAATFTLYATTLKNKSVGACVFVTFKTCEDAVQLDPCQSQTVIGIKPSETTQTKSFSVSINEPAPTTETTEVTPTTSVNETVETNPTTTGTIILTDSTLPLVEPTTTQTPTTTLSPTTQIDDDQVPQTGETNQGLLIGGILLALAASLMLVLHHHRKQE
ncbi:MAG: thioester domain-containing protein [Clostridiaceae bacterium]|nr:thioester domain-containing protein [Clostridiaceae bacterium]